MPVRYGRPVDIAAAVKIKQHRGIVGPFGQSPFRAKPAEIGCLDGHTAGHRKQGGVGVHRLSLFGQRRIALL